MQFQAKQSPHLQRVSTSLQASLLAYGFAAGLFLTGCGSANFAGNAISPVAVASGPQLGYMWMSTDLTLRPILGIPGASQIGKSVVAAGTYQSAVTSAAGTFALMQAVDGSMDIVTLPAGTAAALPVTIASGAALRLSPSGSVGAIYLPGGNSAWIITGLPGNPKIRTVSAGSAIVDAAVSDTGSVAFEMAQGLSIVANAVGTNGASHTVATLGAGGGMSFLPGQDALLLADGAANTLEMIASATTAPAQSVLPTLNLLQAPSALGVSASGRWALVVNGAGNSVVRVDLANGGSTAITCACAPTVAAPLAYEGAFRVTSLALTPNWVVDASIAAPRVLFIPPLPPAQKLTAGGTGVAQ